MIEPKRSIRCEIKNPKYYPGRKENARLHVNKSIFFFFFYKHLRWNKRFLAKPETCKKRKKSDPVNSAKTSQRPQWDSEQTQRPLRRR